MYPLTVSRNNKTIAGNGEGKLAIDESTQCITLPNNICKMTVTTKEIIEKVFPNLQQNYINCQKLSERAIFAAKSYDINTINITILNEIPGKMTTY